MSEKERIVSRKQCIVCTGIIVLAIFLIGASEMKRENRRRDEGIFMLDFCRSAVRGFAGSSAPVHREGFLKLEKNDPEFMLRLNSTELR